MFVQKSDFVALISPAGPIPDDTAIKNAQKILSDWGLQSVVGKNALQQNGHFAGTDTQRLADLQEALDNPDIKMIWALRGGYGSVRIVDKLDFTKFIEHPKLLVGFSDITVLHNRINQLNIPSLHALMPVQFRHKIDQNVLQQTQNAFFGKAFAYDFNFSSFNKNTQNIEGLVVGGNLANLYSLLGTDLDIDTQGKILFIEDIGEHLYNIDRMMIALKKARKLEGLKALIVGDFTDIPKNTPYFGKNYQEIILEHSADYVFPVIFDVPIGHIANNYPLLLGEKLQILIKQNKKVRFLQLQDKLNEL